MAFERVLIVTLMISSVRSHDKDVKENKTNDTVEIINVYEVDQQNTTTESPVKLELSNNTEQIHIKQNNVKVPHSIFFGQPKFALQSAFTKPYEIRTSASKPVIFERLPPLKLPPFPVPADKPFPLFVDKRVPFPVMKVVNPVRLPDRPIQVKIPVPVIQYKEKIVTLPSAKFFKNVHPSESPLMQYKHPVHKNVHGNKGTILTNHLMVPQPNIVFNPPQGFGSYHATNQNYLEPNLPPFPMRPSNHKFLPEQQISTESPQPHQPPVEQYQVNIIPYQPTSSGDNSFRNDQEDSPHLPIEEHFDKSPEQQVINRYNRPKPNDQHKSYNYSDAEIKTDSFNHDDARPSANIKHVYGDNRQTTEPNKYRVQSEPNKFNANPNPTQESNKFYNHPHSPIETNKYYGDSHPSTPSDYYGDSNPPVDSIKFYVTHPPKPPSTFYDHPHPSAETNMYYSDDAHSSEFYGDSDPPVDSNRFYASPHPPQDSRKYRDSTDLPTEPKYYVPLSTLSPKIHVSPSPLTDFASSAESHRRPKDFSFDMSYFNNRGAVQRPQSFVERDFHGVYRTEVIH